MSLHFELKSVEKTRSYFIKEINPYISHDMK